MTSPDNSGLNPSRPPLAPRDQLVQRYHEANVQDQRRPASRVRDAVHAHASMLAAARPTVDAGNIKTKAAANQSRWKVSLLASVALAALTGLLVLQFERGTDEERQTAFGPSRAGSAVTSPPAAVQAPQAEALPSPEKPLSPPAALDAPARRQAKEQTKGEPSEPDRSAPVARRLAESGPAAGVAKSSADSTADSTTANAAKSQAGAPTPKTDQTPGNAPMAGAAPLAAPSQNAVSAESSGQLAAAPPATPAPVPAAAMASRRATAAADQFKSAAGPKGSNTALLDAARNGDLAQIERLMAQGAQLNGADDAGRTALIWATLNGRLETVRRLLALGANPALVDREGLNALDHARRRGLTEIIREIEAKS